MKFKADDYLKDNSDNVTNFGDCSGDLDNQVTIAPQRTIKQAKRRGGNWNRTPTKVENR